jgi:hypothetical protein
VLGLVLGTAGAAIARSARAPGSARAGAAARSRVAVLPFAVHGDSLVGYLGSGIVDLLSTALDGAGELRAVDPRALLAHAGRSGAADVGVVGGAVAAERFGAQRFVLGSVAAAGRAGFASRRRSTSAARRRGSSPVPRFRGARRICST